MFAFSTALWLLLNWCKLYKVKTVSNVSPELRLFSLIKTFLLNWEFSTEFRLFSLVEIFPLSWDFSPDLRLFHWVETFLLSWEFSSELRIFYWAENFLLSWDFSTDLKLFSWVNNFLTPFQTKSLRLSLVTYPSLWSTCVTYRTPCHPNGH